MARPRSSQTWAPRVRAGWAAPGEPRASQPAAAYEFRDPWGNPYDYRYRILPSSSTAIQNASTGAYVTPFSYWLAPGFLIVSCGSNFIEPANPNDAPTFADYWDDSGANPMSKTGIVPATYGDESNTAGPFRSDNITNWTN